MASTQETGHAKNIANFNTLLNHCITLGNRYNPSNMSLEIDSMTELNEAASTALDDVNDAKAAYTLAVDTREEAFKNMMKMLSRIFNTLKASGAGASAINDAASVIRKLRAVPKAKPVAAAAENTPENETAHSNAQTSFDNRVNHFGELVSLLSAITVYNPKELEVKTTTLHTLKESLSTKNQAVLTTYQTLKNKRIERNRLLYAENTGLVDVGYASKSYIRANFSSTGAEYKAIAKLYFRRNDDGVNYTDNAFTVATPS